MATVAFFSDTHLARAAASGDESPDVRLASAVAAVAEVLTPDLVVLPGDVADDGSIEAYHRVSALVERLGAPVVAIAGNHDLPEPLAAVFGDVVDLDLDVWRVVAIDSTIPGEIHGSVDADDVARRLGPDTGRPTVLVIHHPPITVSTNRWFVLDGAAALVELLSSRTDVRMVVSGHLHDAFEMVLGGVVYVGCSSTWYSIGHHVDTWSPDDGHVGALVVTLSPDGALDWRRLPERP